MLLHCPQRTFKTAPAFAINRVFLRSQTASQFCLINKKLGIICKNVKNIEGYYIRHLNETLAAKVNKIDLTDSRLYQLIYGAFPEEEVPGEDIFISVMSPLCNLIIGETAGSKLLSALLMQRFSDIIFISYIATASEWRNRGAAGVLLRRGMEYAKDHRCLLCGEISDLLWKSQTEETAQLLRMGDSARKTALEYEADALSKLRYYRHLGFHITDRTYDVPVYGESSPLSYRIFSWPRVISKKEFGKLKSFTFSNIYEPTNTMMEMESKNTQQAL